MFGPVLRSVEESGRPATAPTEGHEIPSSRPKHQVYSTRSPGRGTQESVHDRFWVNAWTKWRIEFRRVDWVRHGDRVVPSRRAEQISENPSSMQPASFGLS